MATQPVDEEVPRLGVSLAAVRRFAVDVGRHADLGGLRTEEVSALAAARVTAATRCAYVDLLDSDADAAALVGDATVFVSHAWAMPFAALLETLEDVERSERARAPTRTPFFWLDLLVNNQHAAVARSFEWWQTVFLENVRRIGHTVVVLEWETPLPLSRVWCLWEMYCAVSGREDEGAVDGGRAGAGALPLATPLLELRFPPSGVAAFHTMLQHEPEKLWPLLCRVDLKAADAYHGGQCRRLSGGCPAVAAGSQCPDDKARILAAIEAAPSGVDGVTRRVVACLRECMIRTARTELDTIVDADERAASALHFGLCHLLSTGAQYPDATALMRSCYEARRRMFGADATPTLLAAGEVGTLLRLQDRDEEAEPFYREAYDGLRRTLGPAHSDTLTVASHYSRSLFNAGLIIESERLTREVLALSSDGFEKTWMAVVHLGALLHTQGRFAELRHATNDVRELSRDHFGEAHPVTGFVEVLHASGLRGDGAPEAAEALVRATLENFKKSSGAAVFVRFMALMSLAACREERGDLEEAEALLREGHAGSARLFGAGYSDTLTIQRRLADVRLKRGAAAEALVMAAEVLACLRRRHANPRHWETLVALRIHGEAAARLADGNEAALAAALADLRESCEGLRVENPYEARLSEHALVAASLLSTAASAVAKA